MEDKPTDQEPNLETAEKPEMNSHELEFNNDASIDEAVDKIVNEEGDELLAVEDKIRGVEFAPPVKKTGFGAKIKSLGAKWWNNKRLRYGTLIGLVLLVIIAMFVPVTRYGILNTAGVRVSSSMTVVDSITGLPLKNIPVKIQGQEQKSDEEGYVSFSKLKQGKTNIVIDKRGYALLDKNITLGWGSNPIGEQSITATGSQYTFLLVDWLSGQPVKNAEATSGEDVAQSDEEGRIILTVGELSSETTADISAEGYRKETFNLDELNQGETIIKMVVAKKHTFVSNRSGEYDLYKIDVDGTNEEVLLPASSKEREVPFVLSHPTKDVVAYISSRDGDVNSGNFVLDGLFIIDAINGETYKVTRSEQIQLIGWSDNKLIYVAVIEGVSAGNSQRSKLISYDLDTKERVELASSNYFNDVKLINKTVYFAVSSYAVPQSQAKLFSIDTDGKNKKTLVEEQVWSIIRKDYTNLQFSAVDLRWYEQEISGEVKKLDVAPVTRTSRSYSVSPSGEKAVWVDIRDGKGVLLLYDTVQKTESVILTKSGLGSPVEWLNNSTLVYRISTVQETADYVFSIEGTESKKIADVIGNQSRYFY
ncbi:hypothetical protein KBB49_04240 [Candidatus Saccharibacteria bacterium]|nr:hypothetical protein [Candidatus Saccharibacteria bacterium]